MVPLERDIWHKENLIENKRKGVKVCMTLSTS